MSKVRNAAAALIAVQANELLGNAEHYDALREFGAGDRQRRMAAELSLARELLLGYTKFEKQDIAEEAALEITLVKPEIVVGSRVVIVETPYETIEVGTTGVVERIYLSGTVPLYSVKTGEDETFLLYLSELELNDEIRVGDKVQSTVDSPVHNVYIGDVGIIESVDTGWPLYPYAVRIERTGYELWFTKDEFEVI